MKSEIKTARELLERLGVPDCFLCRWLDREAKPLKCTNPIRITELAAKRLDWLITYPFVRGCPHFEPVEDLEALLKRVLRKTEEELQDLERKLDQAQRRVWRLADRLRLKVAWRDKVAQVLEELTKKR